MSISDNRFMHIKTTLCVGKDNEVLLTEAINKLDSSIQRKESEAQINAFKQNIINITERIAQEAYNISSLIPSELTKNHE